jgi:small nuclear ribonucleoprotein (snRNP)-like protein
MADNISKASAETSGSPAEFLKNVVGKEVKVRIGSGIDYEGKLRQVSLCLVETYIDPSKKILREQENSRAWMGT